MSPERKPTFPRPTHPNILGRRYSIKSNITAFRTEFAKAPRVRGIGQSAPHEWLGRHRPCEFSMQLIHRFDLQSCTGGSYKNMRYSHNRTDPPHSFALCQTSSSAILDAFLTSDNPTSPPWPIKDNGRRCDRYGDIGRLPLRKNITMVLKYDSVTRPDTPHTARNSESERIQFPSQLDLNIRIMCR